MKPAFFRVRLPAVFEVSCAIFLSFLSLFWAYATACMCGCLNGLSFVVIGPTFLAAVVLLLVTTGGWWRRIAVFALGVIPPLLLTAKSIADILWNGHGW